MVQGHHCRQDHKPQPMHWGRSHQFFAKFDIDKGETTDLSLDAVMYDTSPSADYESWLLLEQEKEQEQA